jgi:cell shape-determining protein MreC
MCGRRIIFKPVAGVFVAVLLLMLSATRVSAQEQPGTQTESSSQSQSATPEKKPDDSASAKAPAQQAASSEEARQAQYVADSQKLYQLAQELKAEVAKSNKNTLSIAVTKKAEEIEKLAKSLKERMRKE